MQTVVHPFMYSLKAYFNEVEDHVIEDYLLE